MTHLDVLDWVVVLLLALVPITVALAVAMLGVRTDRRRWRDSGVEQRPGYVETRPRSVSPARRIEIKIELRTRRAQDGGQAWGGFVVSYRVDRGARQSFDAELQPDMTLLQLLAFCLQVIDAGERVTGTAARRTAAAAGAAA